MANSINKVCRICMVRKADGILLIDIFSVPKYKFWSSSTIAAAIMECAPIHISCSDGFSNLICDSCFNNLLVAQQFRKVCLHTSQKFLGINTNTIKLNDEVCQIFDDSKIEGIRKYNDKVSDHQNSEAFLSNMVQLKTLADCATQTESIFDSDVLTTIEKTVNNSISVSDVAEESSLNDQPFPCLLCHVNFISSLALTQHERTSHANEPTYTCKECSEIFCVRSRYYKHLKSEHKIKMNIPKLLQSKRPLNCQYCDKLFKKSYEVRAHEKVHTDERAYTCDVCGKGFRTFFTMKNHKKAHTGERPFKCSVCSATRISKDELKRHMRIHDDRFLYQCEVCGKGFKWSTNKVKHMRRHRGERNYTCTTCGKSFYDICILKEHMLTHSDERPFICDLCHVSYKRKEHLRKHLKKIHPNPPL